MDKESTAHAEPAEDLPGGSRSGSSKSWIGKLIQKSPSLALIDQAVVSGTSFLTTIIVGRTCGADGLGLFALAMSVVILARDVQATLISAPYTVYRTRIGKRMPPSEFAGGAMVATVLLSSAFAVLAIIAAILLTGWFQSSATATIAWVLAINLPFSIFREFARRFDMAHLKMASTLKTDLAVSLIQIALLTGMAVRGQLTSATAVLAVGLACASVIAIWGTGRRRDIAIRRPSVTATLRQHWRLGRWLLADQLICFAQLYAMHWMLAAISGATSTGIFAACASIAALASPLLQGIGNYLSPKFAETTARGCRGDTIKLYRKATLSLAVAVTLFAIIAWLFSRELLWIFYRDETYQDSAMVVGILAFRMVFGIPAVAAHHAVVAMEQPRGSASATLVGLMITILAGVPLISGFGVPGAAIAVFLGTGCECLILLFVFAHCVRNWRWTEVAAVDDTSISVAP